MLNKPTKEAAQKIHILMAVPLRGGGDKGRAN